jgi:hypothetical protein
MCGLHAWQEVKERTQRLAKRAAAAEKELNEVGEWW